MFLEHNKKHCLACLFVIEGVSDAEVCILKSAEENRNHLLGGGSLVIKLMAENSGL